MRLLAFDTATPHVTVALNDGSSVVASFESSESMRHGEMLAPGIEQVLSPAGVPGIDSENRLGAMTSLCTGPATG